MLVAGVGGVALIERASVAEPGDVLRMLASAPPDHRKRVVCCYATPMAAIRGMVEVVLVVEDIDRSVAFYQDTLGLDPISPPELPVKFLRIGAARDGVPQQVVLIPRPMAAEQPLVRTRALHHIGLEVAPQDYEHERERLTGLGFEIRGGEHPFMPVGAFYLDDPDGNEIEIATWRG